MRRIIVLPAVLIGSLIVIWVGTVAAAQMPPPALLAPTLTASANQADSLSITAKLEVDQNTVPDSKEKDPACTLPPSYPLAIQQWCQPIEANARQTGLPASLIAAVVLQESSGDPWAYSSSGAVGLMQVMPRDGLAADFMCINGPCFAARPTIAELEDPEFNLAYGSRMLADLVAKHGSYREGLYRYGPINMGYKYADLVLNIWETYQ